MTSTQHRPDSPRHPSGPGIPVWPRCPTCHTDADLDYDAFVPAHCGEDGSPVPSAVSFTCRRCGTHCTLEGPEGWVPPGWEWYD